MAKVQKPDYILSMEKKFQILLNLFKNTALNIFIWGGNLPKGLKSDYIEKKLFERGSLCFFESSDRGFLCLPAENSANLNVYEEPDEYRVQGHNYTASVKADNCVIIKNNPLKTPTLETVSFFLEHLTDIFSAFKVNLNYSKTPFVISGTKEQMLTFQNIIEQITGNKPAIFLDKSMTDLATIEVKSTNFAYIGDKLLDAYDRIEDKLLTFLGINNANTSKRERLVVDEVNSNNDFIENMLDTFLTARKRACEEINEKFGLNITVKVNETYVKEYAVKKENVSRETIDEAEQKDGDE